MTTTRFRNETVISGTLAAAATPLANGGDDLDLDAIEGLVSFFAGHGLDGILALGTTGEGIQFSIEERQRIAERFIESSATRMKVAVHCGAQTTAATVKLCTHAAEAGADAVAVIAPPYFVLGESELIPHFQAAARACSPLPFYVYELERASGYQVPVRVIQRLRETEPNLVGMKVSDAPWERFEPYLIAGLDIFVGPESLISAGLAAGATGAVSALATAFPELVRAAVESGDRADTEQLGQLREAIERFPRHAALKRALVRRGVTIREEVRAPLRSLTSTERASVDELVERYVELPLVAS
jgi:dihydrodipicolinate synthase/N-acetylneuraminate lyase